MRTGVRSAAIGGTAVLVAASLMSTGAVAQDAGISGTTLSVWTMEDATAFEALIAPFEERSGVSVDVEAVPWDSVNDKLTTAVASGQGPDVTQIGLSQLPTFVAAGALEDLAPYIADHPTLGDATFLDAVSAANLNPDGPITSIPWIADTRVLFTRTDILSEAGITAPPATWEEHLAAARTLAARGDGQYGYYIPQWDAPLPVQFTWQAGGDVIDDQGVISLDTDAFRTAVDHYLAFYAEGLVPTASDFDQAAGFISGQTPMVISGPYLANAIKGQAPELDGAWAVSTLPADVTGTALFAGSTVGVWKGSDNVPGALALLEYLSEPATQVAWFEATGSLPTNRAATADPAVTADPNVAVYAAQLEDASLLPLIPAWDRVSGEMLRALNAIALEGADRDATLAQLNQTVIDLQK